MVTPQSHQIGRGALYAAFSPSIIDESPALHGLVATVANSGNSSNVANMSCIV